jgi:hypothetical protein
MGKLYVQGVVQWRREFIGYSPIMLVSVEAEGGRPIRGLTWTDFRVSVKSFPHDWSFCNVWNLEAGENEYGGGKKHMFLGMTGEPYGFYQISIGPPPPYASWKPLSWMVDNCVFSIRVSSDQDYGQALASNFTPAVLPRSLFTLFTPPVLLRKILARIRPSG